MTTATPQEQRKPKSKKKVVIAIGIIVIVLIIVAAVVLVLPKIMSGNTQSAGWPDTGDHDIGVCRNCSTGHDTGSNGHATVSADSCEITKDLRDNRGRHLFLRRDLYRKHGQHHGFIEMLCRRLCLSPSLVKYTRRGGSCPTAGHPGNTGSIKDP